MRRRGFGDGAMSPRMASNTILNCASYRFSRTASLRASSAFPAQHCSRRPSVALAFFVAQRAARAKSLSFIHLL